eukprot:Lithocolla_globosa_v1_NODE_3149_length_1750_cov_12.517404.p1 type:complete len:562 gc:universal NODE_3149_length_1750_cov_12.517404:1724-39(-)
MNTEIEPDELIRRVQVLLETRHLSDVFFSTLNHSDLATRKQAVGDMKRSFLSWCQHTDDEKELATLRQHLPGLFRMSVGCPFEEVRKATKELLNTLKDFVDVPTLVWSSSAFIAPDNLIPLGETGETGELLIDTFLRGARVSQVYRVLSFYPSYMKRFMAVQSALFLEEGPLSQDLKDYVSILACSRFHCLSVLSNQEAAFYRHGGDPSWLLDLKNASPRIQKLSTLNAILAHQPWLLKEEHIQELVSGEEKWSVSEILEAATILITYHCISGFALGVGIVPELDRHGDVLTLATAGVLHENSLSRLNSSVFEGQVGRKLDLTQNTDELKNRLKILSDFSDGDSVTAPEHGREEKTKFFEEAENPTIGVCESPPEFNTCLNFLGDVNYSRFWGNIEMKPEDFNLKSTTYKVARLQDFSWEDHASPLLNQYFPQLGDALDSLFSETLELTEGTLYDSQSIDTWPFRQAIWYYVLRLLGMSHDDYDYSQVNKVLNVNVKKFVKKIVKTPQNITYSDYVDLGLNLFDREKVHLAFLVLEARRQGCLLYVCRAIINSKKGEKMIF